MVVEVDRVALRVQEEPDPLVPEHWDDIAGYAKLAADWLREAQSG